GVRAGGHSAWQETGPSYRLHRGAIPPAERTAVPSTFSYRERPHPLVRKNLPIFCNGPARRVAAWAVAAGGGQGLASGVQGPRSESRHGSKAVVSVAGTAGGAASTRRIRFQWSGRRSRSCPADVVGN